MKDSSSKDFVDISALRASLKGNAGERFWRGLEELGKTSRYRELAGREFAPGVVTRSGKGMSRRNLLKLMAASAAVSGMTACVKMPLEKIVPYVHPPVEFQPGRPLFYATAMPLAGAGIGLLVESHLGRPTKIEGNPDHPASLGATDTLSQASIYGLYDPDRSQVVLREGQLSNWSEVLGVLADLRSAYAANKGEGLRLLTETVTSPTLGDQIGRFLAEFPAAQWHQYEPVSRDSAREGARLAFGEYVNTYYRFDRADVILSLDADFQCFGAGTVRYARDFANKRRITGPQSTMNRLYLVETMPSGTGTLADHRLALPPHQIEAFTRAVATALGIKLNVAAPPSLPSVSSDWIAALVRDLQNHRGSAIVIAGDQQPATVHALAHAMNDALGSVGQTVIYTDPIEAGPANQIQSLRELVSDIHSGQVETLLILGGNPVYDAPADLAFSEALLKVKTRAHWSLYDDETSYLCQWQIPAAHYLESWSDVRAYDGTATVIQPLIAPLYGGKTLHELMSALLGEEQRTPHQAVRDYWKKQNLSKDVERFWEAALERGVIPGTTFPPKSVKLNTAVNLPAPSAQPPGAIEISFQPDTNVWDGRFANNPWLQEVPRPITKLTWDNAAMISPATAERLGFTREEVVKITINGRSQNFPILIVPGHADSSMTLPLGYGRTRAGRVGNGPGFNAYTLRTSEQMWVAFAPPPKPTGKRYHLVTTQYFQTIEQHHELLELESVNAFKRDLIRVATLEEFRKNPDFAADPPSETTEAPSLYPPYNYKEGYQWGMSIDLNSCVGCNACVVACYSENNIATVGKEQVDDGRIMQWIRVDSYFHGDLDRPEIYNEPLPCMMCENAPCEYVCPVGATVHSPGGLNLMIYNRCVGTRYCSNNCPYKVRRFNFYLYSDWTTPSLYGLRNPDVTVRSRGVMEKCTYCIQRIEEAKIKAQLGNRKIRDGEIQTACQQVCPTRAIVFGNINDPDSQVTKVKAQSRQYGLLRELNTRPRTTYLARLRNPNPEIEEHGSR
jgi:molybdopterin-containing oxidoreductase family iron-sulfur binding subunit